MKIREILNQLKNVDKSSSLLCNLSKIGILSRIYVVAQVKANVPGIILGEREPYLREKTLDTFIEELETFGDRFQENEFLMEYDRQLSNDQYESKFFQLTKIEVCRDNVVFHATEDDLVDLRE